MKSHLTRAIHHITNVNLDYNDTAHANVADVGQAPICKEPWELRAGLERGACA